MSAPATFVSNRLAELPAIFNGPQGQAWARGMGSTQDDQAAVARVAAVSRLPALCPDDALDAAGAWLLLPRFPGEPDGTAVPPTGYRGRLIQAFATWRIAGSSGAIIKSFNQWGVPDVEIIGDDIWEGFWYTRFRVLLGPNVGDYNWSVSNPPTENQISQMRGQILKWKWAWSYPVDIAFVPEIGLDPIIVGPLIGYGFIIGEDTIGGFKTI